MPSKLSNRSSKSLIPILDQLTVQECQLWEWVAEEWEEWEWEVAADAADAVVVDAEEERRNPQ